MDPATSPSESPPSRTNILGSFLGRGRPRNSFQSQSHIHVNVNPHDHHPLQHDPSASPQALQPPPSPNNLYAAGLIGGSNGRRRNNTPGGGDSSSPQPPAAQPLTTSTSGGGGLANMLRRRRSAGNVTAAAVSSASPPAPPALSTAHANAAVHTAALALGIPSRSILHAQSQHSPLTPTSTTAMTQPNPTSAGPSHRIRLVPHLDSRRSLRFDPISRDLREGEPALRIGRFTDRSGGSRQAVVNIVGSNKLAFRSKVVSRAHAELWVEPGGKFFIKDTKSSSGTFLNHMRLSAASQESKPHQIKDGDIVQLGVDYQGGEDDIYKSVKIRIEVGREWQAGPNAFNTTAFQHLKFLAGPIAGPVAPPNTGAAKSPGPSLPSKIPDCCICLFPVTIRQALFIAPCSHAYHYKCIRPLLEQHHPAFSCPLCRTFADLEEDVEIEGDEGEEGEAGDTPGDQDEAERERREREREREELTPDVGAVASPAIAAAACVNNVPAPHPGEEEELIAVGELLSTSEAALNHDRERERERDREMGADTDVENDYPSSSAGPRRWRSQTAQQQIHMRGSPFSDGVVEEGEEEEEGEGEGGQAQEEGMVYLHPHPHHHEDGMGMGMSMAVVVPGSPAMGGSEMDVDLGPGGSSGDGEGTMGGVGEKRKR